MQGLQNLRQDLLGAVAAANDLGTLDATRVEALGKNGRITALMKTLGGLSPDERKQAGQALNDLKNEITEAIESRLALVKAQALAERLESERLDVTLPVTTATHGMIHPISQTIEEITAIFADMGFQVAEGPDVEDDFHNFTALNMDENHPARQMHDTFYLPARDGVAQVLRTHTSPVQIRTMIGQQPPIRIIAPGRTYRSDYDQTHTPMFHQVEALYIDRDVTMAQLKGVIVAFLRAFFGIADLPVRFRPSFFPFTEPSAEVDIGCSRQNGELKLGAGGDWLEIMGCGMVHENVLKNCGIDSNQYQGFALGMGVERCAMLKYGIPDLRSFFESDLRWLHHYGFVPSERPNLAQGI